jgi:sugar phosphate isomerase/epimerase
MGYRYVELAGFYGLPAADLRALLDDCGLSAIAAHIPLDKLTADLPQVIADLKALGCPTAVLPWIAPELRADESQVRVLAAQCNTIGAALATEQIAFVYHNEDYDFMPILENSGFRIQDSAALLSIDRAEQNELQSAICNLQSAIPNTLWHTLLATTEPTLLRAQLDVFTALAQGCDVPSLLGEYGSRIASLHVCDRRDGAYAPIGTGDIDWVPLLAVARAAQIPWLIVEQDAPPDPLGDAATSLQNLQALLGVEP